MNRNIHILPIRRLVSGKIAPLTILLYCLLFFGTANGVCMGDEEGEAYTVQVVVGSESFDVPFSELSTGDRFRLYSLEPSRWQWSGGAVEYTGWFSTWPSGNLAGIPLPPGITPGVYEFDVQIGSGEGGIACWSDPLLLKVNVVNKGETVIRTLCSGELLEYLPECVVSGENQASDYHWSRKSVDGIRETGTSGSGGISETLTNTTHEMIAVRYVYLSDTEDCRGMEGHDLLVYVKPDIQFTVENKTPELCSGETTDILILPVLPGTVNFKWEVTGEGASGMEAGTGQSIQQTLYFDENPATVEYRILPEGENCSAEQRTVVTVKELPEIELNGQQQATAVSFGKPITIEAWPGDYKNYIFTFNGQKTEQSDPVLVVYDWIADGSNEVSVTVYAGNGCGNTISRVITGPQFNMPNAFTPNGDGVNDLFYPDFELEVYNPNGSQLYKGKDGWDGRYKGQVVPTGTYLYIVRYNTPEGKQIIQKYHVYVRTN